MWGAVFGGGGQAWREFGAVSLLVWDQVCRGGTRCHLNSPLVTLMAPEIWFACSAWLGRVVWLTVGGESGSPAGATPPHQAVLLPPSQGMSETFETLHNLVHKGVKVVMDIPYELWNETSAEVADLKKQVPRPKRLAFSGCCDLVGWSGSGESIQGCTAGSMMLAGPVAGAWPWSCHTSTCLELGSPLCPSAMCW